MKADQKPEWKNRGVRKQARPGAALIMVLALLSILIVLAIGFSASMRTEQRAANNYEASARGRGLVPTAIQQAVVDIEADYYDLETAAYYDDTDLIAPLNTASGAPQMKIYPNANLMHSKGTAVADDFIVKKMLRTGTQFYEDWVPDTYLTDLTTAVNGGDIQWEALLTNKGKTIGRARQRSSGE